MDFENAEDDGVPREFHPYRDLIEWTLEASYLWGSSQRDPMIPTLKESMRWVDNNKFLMALAACKVHALKCDT